MDACSIPGTGRGIVERVVAVLIGILLAVSAIELTQESVVAAASAGVVSYLALRLGIRGECGWGSRDSYASDTPGMTLMRATLSQSPDSRQGRTDYERS